MTKFYLYTDKNEKICESKVNDPQTFYLNKNAVCIIANGITEAMMKYRQLQTNDFYQLNLNEIE